jgi:hypothetical protein
MYERENSRSAKKARKIEEREKSGARKRERKSEILGQKKSAKAQARSLKKARAQLCCTDNFLTNSSIMHYTE